MLAACTASSAIDYCGRCAPSAAREQRRLVRVTRPEHARPDGRPSSSMMLVSAS